MSTYGCKLNKNPNQALKIYSTTLEASLNFTEKKKKANQLGTTLTHLKFSQKQVKSSNIHGVDLAGPCLLSSKKYQIFHRIDNKVYPGPNLLLCNGSKSHLKIQI